MQNRFTLSSSAVGVQEYINKTDQNDNTSGHRIL